MDNVVIRARAKHAVDLRHLVHDLLLIALRETAGDEDLPDTALLFERAHRQNMVDGLFLGRIDETAGVDDHQLRPIGIRQNFISGLPQQIEHLLGVDLIFGTTGARSCRSYASFQFLRHCFLQFQIFEICLITPQRVADLPIGKPRRSSASIVF